MVECVDCKFYKRLNDGGGQCRRYAPRQANSERPWAMVWSNDWCGEFERKPVEIVQSAAEMEIRARYWKNREFTSEMGAHVEKAATLAKEYGLSINRFRTIVLRDAPYTGWSHQRPPHLRLVTDDHAAS